MLVNRLKKLAMDQDKFAKKLKVVERQTIKTYQVKQERQEVLYWIALNPLER